MKRFLLPLIVVAAAAGLYVNVSAAQTNAYRAQVLPPAKRASRVQIRSGPGMEMIRSNWAIIRWTSTNPRGADEHFAIAHYGTDPKQLGQVAKSHIRLNQNHSETVFRLMVTGLTPKTTYYYTVDSMGGDGTPDGVKTQVLNFTTP